MGFRFRRSIGLGKFLRLNVGKRSIGASVGVPGLRMGIGPRGPRLSAGLPGTGMSWNTSLAGSGGQSSKSGCGGCLLAMLGLFAFSAFFAGMSKSLGPEDAGKVMAVLLVAGLVLWIFVARGRKRALREAREAAIADAEQQRILAEQHAEAQKQQRWNYLTGRFGQDIAQKIWAGQLWVGQTAEMLTESLGAPLERDEKISRQKVMHVYKYRPLPGHNRWGLRVELEDGTVCGWDAKEV